MEYLNDGGRAEAHCQNLVFWSSRKAEFDLKPWSEDFYILFLTQAWSYAFSSFSLFFFVLADALIQVNVSILSVQNFCAGHSHSLLRIS